MYCYRCHAKTYDGQKYCIKCGAPLNEDSSESCCGQPEIQDSYDSFTYSDMESRSTYGYQGQDTRMVYIGIGVIVLVVIVLIVVGIVILGSNPFPTDHVSTGDARNESAEQMLDLPDNSPSSPKKPQAEIIEEPGNSPIAVAKRAVAQEYYKYLDRMDKVSFMKTATSNDINIDMLNRQPDDYVGKEVYFGGTVIQVIYDDSDMSEVQMRVRIDGGYTVNDVFYTYYYLQDDEDRILEEDYVKIYGISEGLITYESVRGNSITVPLIQTVYLSSSESEEPQKTPALQTATRRTAGEFIADSGKTISFPYLKNGQSFILSDATDYGDCIIVYYAPEGNGSENTSLPRYRIATFDDGSIVVFEPQGREFADIYSIDEGTYTLYKPGKAKNQSSNTSSNTAPTTPAKKSSSGNSTVIYTGYVTYTSGGLNIRNGPGVNYQKVGKLSSGDQVSIFEITQSESGSWGRIQQGWISMDYIQTTAPSSSIPFHENTPSEISLPEQQNHYLTSDKQYLDGDIRNTISQFLVSSEISYKQKCYTDSVDYANALNNASFCKGTQQVFQGKVVSCGDSSFLLETDQGNVLVSFPDGYNPGIMINQYVTSYGTLNGTSTYTSNGSGLPIEKRAPFLCAQYVDGKHNESDFYASKTTIGSEILELDGSTYYDNELPSSLSQQNYVIESAQKKRTMYGEEYLEMAWKTVFKDGSTRSYQVKYRYITQRLEFVELQKYYLKQ